MTKCESCGSSVGYVAASDVKVTCSTCVMQRITRQESQLEARLATLDPAEVKSLRKGLGWTQADLALVLRLPTKHVSDFERGLALPPEKLYAWAQQES